MKKLILFISAILIFVSLNAAIYQKERIKGEGEVILFKLEPVDPRALIQGNYMALHYAIEDEMSKIDAQQLLKHRFAVIAPDENNVAKFVRLYQGEKLSPNEKLIKYRYQGRYLPQQLQIHLKPNSFLFQEDLLPLYQKAAYAIFHYHGAKDYLLVGMADKERKKLSAKTESPPSDSSQK